MRQLFKVLGGVMLKSVCVAAVSVCDCWLPALQCKERELLRGTWGALNTRGCQHWGLGGFSISLSSVQTLSCKTYPIPLFYRKSHSELPQRAHP